MKKKKKSKLQKKKEDPNSTLWRNKADKLWKDIVAIQGERKCAICGSVEYVQAHHLIPREMYSHRHVPQNGIMLCASHHKYSFEISPHKAPVAFFRWMQTNRSELTTWVMAETPSRRHPTKTLKEIAESLQILFDSIKTPDVTQSGARIPTEKEVT
jgi:hypothetical protein